MVSSTVEPVCVVELETVGGGGTNS